MSRLMLLGFSNLCARVSMRPAAATLVASANHGGQPQLQLAVAGGSHFLHTSSALNANYEKPQGPRGWQRYNKIVYEPQAETEAPRPAFVCHHRANIKYSPWKMWYIASMVRGLPVDEALRQLSFVLKKGAEPVRETILEAQRMAVEEHNVEFRTNLWVAESFCTKGRVFKGVRRHARARVGRVLYFHCHYYVRLEEGTPPADYYGRQTTPAQQLDDWMDGLRKRKIIGSL